jgi:hypothetical protein
MLSHLSKKYLFFGFLILILSFIFFTQKNYIGVDTNENTNLNLNKNLEDNKKVLIDNLDEEVKEVSPLSGVSCQNYKARPFAVMMAGDQQARPLSGISMADIVVEAPVITNDITRYMAIFLCETPEEIGSLRSARDDFIPLAKGWDAIYVHWGGSHFALDTLKQKVIDNIDALTNPFNTFYRKPSIPKPHNGFTTYEKLKNAAISFNFRLENSLSPYPFLKKSELKSNPDTFATLIITYPGKFKVKYVYDGNNMNYKRFKDDTPEIDALTKNQVIADNVLVLETISKQIEGQYNDLKVIGEGKLKAYINGQEILGTWRKADFNSKLTFFNEQNQEISLKPGKTWIQFIDQNEEAVYFKR